MRAKTKVRGYPPAALRADRFGFGPGYALLRPAGLIEDPATPIALQEAPSPFDRKDGDKEEAQIVVQPFEPG